MEIVLKEEKGVPYFACDGFLAAGGVAHGFSTRQGGVSQGIWASLDLGFKRGDDPEHVRENYRRFCAAIGADSAAVVKNHQVHGDQIRAVTQADLGVDLCDSSPWQADGLICDVPGLCLTVFTADCLPVLLYAPRRRCIAAVHSGWRGTAQRIAQKAAERMIRDYGCAPDEILAAVGPGISPCCFETHQDVPDAMYAALGSDIDPMIQPLSGGKYRVDLKGIVRKCLLDAGLAPEHIAVSDRCTACTPDCFWSHRRLGSARGSMAAMIQLL